jgi:hypothetical protein
MTSPLRKRPPTTASPTPRTRTNSPSHAASVHRPRRLGPCGAILSCSIAALIASILWGRLGPAYAAEPRVKTVSYTTGKAGHTLKWLPTGAAEPGAVKPAQAAEDLPAPLSSGAVGPVLSAPADAFADPFDDSKKKPEPAAARPNPQGNKEAPDKGTPGATGLKPSSQARQLLLPPPETAKPTGRRPEEIAAGPPAEPSCPEKGRLDKDVRDILQRVQVKFAEQRPRFCVLEPRDPVDRSTWQRTTFMWKASALCHKPAYFEDESVERYGHTYGPWAQPIVSGGHFFLTVPIMPYLMALYPPHECVYTLGYYRPGSCAPFTLDPLPLSIRAAIAEGGVWTGMVFLIP